MKKLLVFMCVFILGVSNMAQVAMATSVSDNVEDVVEQQPTETPEEEVQEPDAPSEEPAQEQPVEELTDETPIETPAEEPIEDNPSEEPTEEPSEEEQPTEVPVEEQEESEEETTATIVIPDFTGQNYEEVREQMEAVTGVSWMLEYIYSDEVAEDVIISQNVSGELAMAENYTVNVVISLGSEPEVVEEEDEKLDLLSPIGLGPAFSEHGLGVGNFAAWDNMPSSYEYNWDNSESCWKWGVWYEGECYLTPEGEYSNDVRHKIGLYTDGVNVHCYIRFATCYGPGFNSEDLQFYVNGQMAAFQLTFKPDGVVTGNVADLEPGVYEVEVKHRNSSMSYSKADGSVAYLQIDPAGKNNAVEMVIPLETLKEQNPAIDLSRIDSLEFFSPNLMYRRVKCSGADTAPFVWAAAALVCVPSGAMIYRKKSVKKEQ